MGSFSRALNQRSFIKYFIVYTLNKILLKYTWRRPLLF